MKALRFLLLGACVINSTWLLCSNVLFAECKTNESTCITFTCDAGTSHICDYDAPHVNGPCPKHYSESNMCRVRSASKSSKKCENNTDCP